VGSAAVDFFQHTGRHNGERDQLRMAMLQRGAGGGAVVFEDEDIAKAQVFFQVDDAVPIRPQHVFDLFGRQIREAVLVSW
jgi:hypothetical protein